MSITRCKHCEYMHDTDFEAEHEEMCGEERKEAIKKNKK